MRVLIVEDSAVQRKMVRAVLEPDPRIEIVGGASNGELAVARLAAGEIDVLTLDLEMPVLDGIGVLEYMRANRCVAGAVVLSALSREGARKSIEAMMLGAFDFIAKPTGSDGGPEAVVEELRKTLLPRVIACAEHVQHLRGAAPISPAVVAPRPALPARAIAEAPEKTLGKPEMVVLGSSTGGPQALESVLSSLPADLTCPVLVVQHMPPMFTKSLAESLDRKCAVHVAEATDGDTLRAGEVLIAPGGFQMRVVERAGKRVVEMTEDPPIKSCRPSVDYLFRSAARVCGGRALAVILTGMGEDGTDGARLLTGRGARLLVQDRATCVVFGMPRIPAEEGWADEILPLEEIGAAIARHCGNRVRA